MAQPVRSLSQSGPRGAIVAQGDRAVAQHLRGWPAASGDVRLAAGTPAGLDIVFGSDGNAAAVTRAGWSAPEPGYTWTIGQSSALVLPRPAAAARHELQLQVTPFVQEQRLGFQRLILEINGTRVAAPRIPEQVVVSVELPWEILAARDAVECVFTLPDAARPIDVTGFADDRVLGFAFRRLLLTPIAPPPITSPPGPSPARASADAAGLPRDALMLRFESLGENCEFGLAQRRCGAEPLGLLRFASAPLPKLLAALRARFHAMGTPDNILVELSSNGQEYMIQDRAFGFNYHAWVRRGEHSPAEIHARETRRVPFLARKLIEDLTAGEKIFVYHGMEPLSPGNARNLAAFIRGYGPGTLFWVELADSGHPPGSVERLDAGVLKGYIDRFAPPENAHDFALESWVDLCRRAVSLLGQ